jgi:hypothetical protein
MNFWTDYYSMFRKHVKKTEPWRCFSKFARLRHYRSMNVENVKTGLIRYKTIIAACCRLKNRIVYKIAWRNSMKRKRFRVIHVKTAKKRSKRSLKEPIYMNYLKLSYWIFKGSSMIRRKETKSKCIPHLPFLWKSTSRNTWNTLISRTWILIIGWKE